MYNRIMLNILVIVCAIGALVCFGAGIRRRKKTGKLSKIVHPQTVLGFGLMVLSMFAKLLQYLPEPERVSWSGILEEISTHTTILAICTICS